MAMLLYSLFRAPYVLIDRLRRRSASWIYSTSFARCGPGFECGKGIYIRDPRQVECGQDVYIGDNCILSSELSGGTIRLEDRVTVNLGVSLDYSGDLLIGEGTLISARSVIFTHSHGLDPRSIPSKRPKRIGRHVWIGAKAIILESANVIGDHAVIGSGAVVTKDVPPGAIVAGNPARIIRYRTDIPDAGA